MFVVIQTQKAADMQLLIGEMSRYRIGGNIFKRLHFASFGDTAMSQVAEIVPVSCPQQKS